MKQQVSKYMTSSLRTVQSSDLLLKAYQRMKSEGVRHLPVLDDDANIVGIISDRDLQRAIGATEGFVKGHAKSMPKFEPEVRVSDYMSWPVETVSGQTNLLEVTSLMIDKKISAVLVTENDELAGIVTHEDLLSILRTFLKPRPSVKDRIAEWTYSSPISHVIRFLGDAGI